MRLLITVTIFGLFSATVMAEKQIPSTGDIPKKTTKTQERMEHSSIQWVKGTGTTTEKSTYSKKEASPAPEVEGEEDQEEED